MLLESESPTLPAGSSEPLENNNLNVESFDSAINEAKKSLDGEVKAQTKRPRGRPRKEHLKIVEEPLPTPNPEPIPQMDFKPIVIQGMKWPFKIWATKSDCRALELTDAEAETPAGYADAMLNYYAPRMDSLDPGKTAMVMFLISVLMLVGEKGAVLETQRSGKSEKAEPKVAEAEKPISEAPSIPKGSVVYNSPRL